MVVCKRLLFWLVAVAAYWYCAYWCVFWCFPVGFDGSGVEPGLWFGHLPQSPTTGEWQRKEGAGLLAWYPYLAAASTITALGVGLRRGWFGFGNQGTHGCLRGLRGWR